MSNSNMVLQCKEGGEFKPHPEGIHPAVCLDVIDLGLVETEFQGERRMTPRVKVVFESEQRMEDGRPFTISKNFTASIHPKAKLAEFLGKWRGRPVVPGESIDLGKLIGACCTLVVSHQQNVMGRTYASIDAISKPTRKVAPSGSYDPAMARQRIADWKARQGSSAEGRGSSGGQRTAAGSNQSSVTSHQGPAPKSSAAPAAAATATVPAGPNMAFDPEIGF